SGHPGFEDVRAGPSSGNGQDARQDVTLDTLIEQAARDYRVAYRPAIIEAMSDLKSSDLERFVLLYGQLKKIRGFSATLFNQAIGQLERSRSSGGPGVDPSEVLLGIVGGFSGFRTDSDVVFFDVDVDDHRETLRAHSNRLVSRVRALYFGCTGGRSVSTDAVKTAIDTIAARVEWTGPSRPVFYRIGADDAGNLYLDLHRDDWSYVKITPDGWQVCQRPALGRIAPEDAPALDMPVRFLHSRNALPLPIPQHGGSIDALRKFLTQREDHFEDEITFTLVVGWLVGALHPRGPYPGLGLGGAPGSGKTTMLRLARRLIDPNRAIARSVPRNERDLAIAASRSFIQSADNLSNISHELSDAMCRLSTGGGLATRTLYSDDEETVFDNCRPIILTAIAEVVTRPDLADRFISLILPARESANRRPDAAIEEDFQAAWPFILGALLTAASAGLRRLPDMPVPEDLPRMAGFAQWVTACEPGLGWEPGTFLRAYHENIKAVANTVMEADPIAFAIVKWAAGFPKDQPSWTGTAEEALAKINAVAGHAAQSSKNWPRSARGLVNRLRTLAPFLTRFGVAAASGPLLHGRTQWIITQGEPG
ncbi:MAG: hypothetical protein ACJ8AW_03065, partial [Rhodopila sp.]